MKGKYDMFGVVGSLLKAHLSLPHSNTCSFSRENSFTSNQPTSVPHFSLFQALAWPWLFAESFSSCHSYGEAQPERVEVQNH